MFSGLFSEFLCIVCSLVIGGLTPGVGDVFIFARGWAL